VSVKILVVLVTLSGREELKPMKRLAISGGQNMSEAGRENYTSERIPLEGQNAIYSAQQ
jgi:hypothetical protein